MGAKSTTTSNHPSTPRVGDPDPRPPPPRRRPCVFVSDMKFKAKGLTESQDICRLCDFNPIRILHNIF